MNAALSAKTAILTRVVSMPRVSARSSSAPMPIRATPQRLRGSATAVVTARAATASTV